MTTDNKTFSDAFRLLIEHLALANSDLRQKTGACFISIPGEVTPHCARLTEQQCRDVGGVYTDGNCPDHH